MINLFKQNEGFATSTFKSKDGSIPKEIKDDIIQVEDSVFKDLEKHKLMWSNGELVNNPNYEDYQAEIKKERDNQKIKQRIEELKQLLNETDYRAVKYAEGLYTEEEYKPYKELRQSYRDEINELEKQL